MSSLNVLTRSEDGEPTELIQTLDQCDADRRASRQRRRSEADLAALRMDLARAISQLPPEWQRMLELCKYHSLCEVAELMDVPRTTLSSWMCEVRSRLADQEFDTYFEF
jgi:DNA-directed RNA polymerase specialized sigma24 family protein